MKRLIQACIVFSLIVFASMQVLSQNNKASQEKPKNEKSFVISVQTELVVLPVTVLDKSGEFVKGLEEKDFAVYEDGVRQSIEVFDNKDIPVVLGLMIDNSSSMSFRRDEVFNAAGILAKSSNPEDELFVGHFYSHVTLNLPLSEYAHARDQKKLEDAVSDISKTGKTALYDAVCAGLQHLKQGSLTKKALVIISDGADNASKHTLNEALEMAKTSNALVYSIGLFDNRNRERKPEILDQLSEISGGKTFVPTMDSDVAEACRRIAVDIRSQYTIGYAPSSQKADGRFRKIRVEVQSAKNDKLTVRTRSGYTK